MELVCALFVLRAAVMGNMRPNVSVSLAIVVGASCQVKQRCVMTHNGWH